MTISAFAISIGVLVVVPVNDPRYPEFYGLIRGIATFGIVIASFLLIATIAGSVRLSKAFRAVIPDYLNSIGYYKTANMAAEPSGSQDRHDDMGPHYWATGNYDPERYFRETKGWSKEHREYVRDAYGDLDTYEANQPN